MGEPGHGSTGNALRRPLQVLRAALAFALFLSGGLVLAYLVLPLSALAARLRGEADPEAVSDHAHALAQRAYRLFLRVSASIGAFRVTVRQGERLRFGPGALVACNHPSLLDTPVVASLFPTAYLIVGETWTSMAAPRRVAAAAGYLWADRGAGVIAAGAEQLRRGRTVVMFPEGTRSPEGGLRPFKRGAAHMALESGSDLLPVLIRCDMPVLRRHQKWYDVGDRPLGITVEVGEPIDPGDFLQGDETRVVAARKVTAGLREHFAKRIHVVEP